MAAAWEVVNEALRSGAVVYALTSALAARKSVMLDAGPIWALPVAAIMILAISSEVANNIPQFAAIGPYLPTHWWLAFDSILRARTQS
jgi:hypothetical protein